MVLSQPSPPRSCIATAAEAGKGGVSTDPPHHPPQQTSKRYPADAALTPLKLEAADNATAAKQTTDSLATPSVPTLLEATTAGSLAVTLSSAAETGAATTAAAGILTTVVAVAAAEILVVAPAVAAAGSLAVAQAVVLDAAALREVARHNQDVVLQALAAASAAGSPPEVRALLAEPSWRAALSGVLGGSKTRSLQVCAWGRWVGGWVDRL